MHYFDWKIKAYAHATAHLTNGQDLAYRRMLEYYYDTESPLPLDLSTLARRLRVPIEDVQIVIQDFFEKHENSYNHAICDAAILNYKTQKNNSSKGGKKSAEVRRQRKQALNEVHLMPTSSTLEDHFNQSVISNNKSVISNQESIIKELAVSDESLPAVQESKKIKIGFDYDSGQFLGMIDKKPLFESWMIAYPGVDIREELNKMRAWLMSNKANRKTNLSKFINNWLSKAQDQACRPNNKTFAQQTQEYKDEQARKFYAPLLEADQETLKKWGFA